MFNILIYLCHKIISVPTLCFSCMYLQSHLSHAIYEFWTWQWMKWTERNENEFESIEKRKLYTFTGIHIHRIEQLYVIENLVRQSESGERHNTLC